jgi:hypothetical protein
VEKVVSIQFGAHGCMQPKWIPGLLAGALKNREEGLHDVPREGIGEGIIIKGIKNVSRYKRTVERHRHCG